ncbi:hypothetical protein G6541_29010, partial [Streptomyces albidoflavus]|nr:hypothetical protein [Streptomyces albidoflavus]
MPDDAPRGRRAPAGPGGGPAPLVIACALTIERLALRTGIRAPADTPTRVLRTGMGPEA